MTHLLLLVATNKYWVTRAYQPEPCVGLNSARSPLRSWREASGINCLARGQRTSHPAVLSHLSLLTSRSFKTSSHPLNNPSFTFNSIQTIKQQRQYKLIHFHLRDTDVIQIFFIQCSHPSSFLTTLASIHPYLHSLIHSSSQPFIHIQSFIPQSLSLHALDYRGVAIWQFYGIWINTSYELTANA